MNQHMLFASVPAQDYDGVLSQLSGICAMQPVPVYERHLVFEAYKPSGFMKPSIGATQHLQAGLTQQLNKAISSSTYFLQAVGEISANDFATPGGGETNYKASKQPWRVEFNDIPSAAWKSTNFRLSVGADMPSGDILPFMKAWGFDYVSEHILEGQRFILEDAVILIFKLLRFPSSESERPAETLPARQEMKSLDPSEAYVLQATVNMEENSSPELLSLGERKILRLRDYLRPLVKLTPADRLSLDTRRR